MTAWTKTAESREEGRGSPAEIAFHEGENDRVEDWRHKTKAD